MTKKQLTLVKISFVNLVWIFYIQAVFILSYGHHAPSGNNIRPIKPSIFQSLSNYDSSYYVNIATSGYKGVHNIKHLAFYPLYPLILRSLQTLTFHSIDIRSLAFAFNLICIFSTSFLLYKISELIGIKHPIIVVITWLFFPWSLFLATLYTESLFCLLVSLALFFSLKKQWWAAVVVAGLASATRFPGLLVGIFIVFEYMRVNNLLNKSIFNFKYKKKVFKSFVLFAISISGFICWLSYQWYAFGTPFAFRKAYSLEWKYQKFSLNIFRPIFHDVYNVLDGLAHMRIRYEIFEIGSWLFVLALLVIAIKTKLNISNGWKLFIALNLVIVLLNSNTVSVNRYMMPLMVTYFILALLVEKFNNKLVWTCLSLYLVIGLIVQIYMSIRFANTAWVG
ncbi:MAG: hypothetical protein U0R17_01810 [Acidimicrobiia bacterium]